MCRIAAYMGEPLMLDEFLRPPGHSLYRQSWEPREMLTATVNADGYGVSWESPENRPVRYRSTLPIWADTNLAGLGSSLTSRWWMGNVRSATEGLGTHIINTQPYIDEKWSFCHNGFITDFQKLYRRRMRAALDDAADGATEGNTDSEHIFSLLSSQRADPVTAFSQTMELLRDWIGEAGGKALLAFALTDGEALYAVRAGIGAAAPSLYVHPQYPLMRHGSVIASEPFDDDPGWTAVNPDTLVVLRPGDPPRGPVNLMSGIPLTRVHLRLAELRSACLRMLDEVDETQVYAQPHPDLSPLAWHVGHCFHTESLWLRQKVLGEIAGPSELVALYNPEYSDKALRGQHSPDLNELADFCRRTEEVNVQAWTRVQGKTHDLLQDDYLQWFLLQHYAQHLETMQMLLQQHRICLANGPQSANAPLSANSRIPVYVDIAAGPSRVGSRDRALAYDNELGRHSIHLAAYRLGCRPVSNSKLAGVHAGQWLPATGALVPTRPRLADCIRRLPSATLADIQKRRGGTARTAATCCYRTHPFMASAGTKPALSPAGPRRDCRRNSSWSTPWPGRLWQRRGKFGNGAKTHWHRTRDFAPFPTRAIPRPGLTDATAYCVAAAALPSPNCVAAASAISTPSRTDTYLPGYGWPPPAKPTFIGIETTAPLTILSRPHPQERHTVKLPSGINEQVGAALQEDIGAGDCNAVVADESARSTARVIVREPAILAGAAWFDEVFAQTDDRVRVQWQYRDGQRLAADTTICEINGPTRALLTGERTALNFIQLLSGAATTVGEFVERVKHTRAQILDTRKTLPNLRAAQKYAVLCGGGVNHRFGLFDGVLIKENHIAAAGSVARAVERVRRHSPALSVQIEVENLDELQQALELDVESVLLDNFTNELLSRAVDMAASARTAHQRPVVTEASGDVRLANVAEIAETGVHRISIGSLTKHVRATDFSMRMHTA